MKREYRQWFERQMNEYKIVLLLLLLHITGGCKSKFIWHHRILFVIIIYILGVETRSSKSNLDCKQYANDYEILHHFPFRIKINPMLHDWESNIAVMDKMNTFVSSLDLTDTGSTIPESIFCLKKLDRLLIMNMVFMNGNKVIFLVCWIDNAYWIFL